MITYQIYLDLIMEGQKEYQAARSLHEHDVDNETVCFHCQRAIENYFKAYLLKHSQTPVEGLGLVKLCKMSGNYEQGILTFLKDVALINEYNIENKDSAYEPVNISNEDMYECLSITEKVLAYIERII